MILNIIAQISSIFTVGVLLSLILIYNLILLIKLPVYKTSNKIVIRVLIILVALIWGLFYHLTH